MNYDASTVPPLVLREPARSFPFLTDGDDLYLVEGWRAESANPKRFEVRRLTAAERSLVERALRDAAEESAYRLAARRPTLSGRARPARPARS